MVEVNDSSFRYNKVKRNSREVEFELVKDEVEEIDKLIQKGQKELNWNSDSKLILCSTITSYYIWWHYSC